MHPEKENMFSVSKRSAAPDGPCGVFRHLLIMIYDGVVIMALLMLSTAVAMLFGMDNYTAAEDPIYTTYLVTVWFAYLGWCWHGGGMTLGMRAWRVRIESDSGALPGWSQCLLRFLSSLFSAAFAGLGFVWPLFNRQKRTWHDLASRTRLVNSANT